MTPTAEARVRELKKINPGARGDGAHRFGHHGEERAIELARQPFIEHIDVIADVNGNQIDSEKPKFVKDMMRHIHTTLGKRRHP